MNSSSHHHEEFVRLFARHEGNVRAFVASLLPDWEGVDDLMQEASLVMWRKFDQFDPDRAGSNFVDWAFMIARYEVLMYRRQKATDRLVFSDDVYDLLAAEAANMAFLQPDRERALRQCLTKLESAQRELLQVAYAEGVSIKDAAERVGRTPTAFYEALARIRRSLLRCISVTRAEGPMGGSA